MEYILVLITVMLNIITECQSFRCYSCSYTRSTDPSLSYECVTDPANVTTGMLTMDCQVPNMCITKTLFNQDMSHIRSVTRVCFPQQEICQGESCCNMNGVYPACEHKCRSDMCNKISPERWLKKPGTGNDATNDKGNGGQIRLGDATLACLMASLVLFR